MGVGHNSERVQTRIHTETKISRCKNYKCTCQSKTNNFRRNSKTFRQKRNRKSRKEGCVSRFLQYIFLSTQEKWGNETCHKLTPSQPVSREKTLQNGYNDKSPKPGRKGGLGIQSRSVRCLFSPKDFQKTSEIFTVQFSRPGVSIPSNEFRTNGGSSGLHESYVSGSSSFTKTRNSSGFIFGRLDSIESNQKVFVERSTDYADSPFSTGFHCEQDKIQSSSQSGRDLHWGSFSSRQGVSFSNSGKNPGFDRSCERPVTGSELSSPLPGSAGKDSFVSRFDSQCTLVHAAYPTASASKLESNKNVYVSSDSGSIFSYTKPEMVVTGSKFVKGQLFSVKTVFSSCHNRCQSDGLGWSHEQLHSTGSMVECSKASTHKLSRNESCVFNIEAFPSHVEKPECFDPNRQYHSNAIFEQTRWDEIKRTVFVNMGNMDACSGKQHVFESSSHCREKEHFGRQTEQICNKTDRMVFESISSIQSVSDSGQTAGGFICHSPEQESSDILFVASKCSSPGNRCAVCNMGQHVCICLSTDGIDSQSVAAYETVSLSNNTDSAFVAETNMVSTDVETISSLASETSQHTQPIVSGNGDNITPQSSDTRVDSMAIVNRRFTAAGFSERTRELLAASWRKGTKRDYNSKFKQFNSWCSERNVDSYSATLKDCADFLTFLFDKGLKYRTINGYRSMLSSILPAVEKCPIGQHPYIIRLLRGVFNERPPVKMLIPEWDLSIILGCLREKPFEPLKKAALKYLAWKTCFLIAITTFRRCSDIQSLQLGDTVNVYKRGITFVRTGLAKQDRANHDKSHIFVPAFPSDKLLDPKRCIYWYLKRTEQFRRVDEKDIVKLFLATKKPHKPVSCQTLSSWIVKIIKYCYKQKKKSLSNVRILGHSTRSVGPSWALFKGASIKSIMDSADWSTENTFVKHYLKAVKTHVLEV